jgi:hypothetical protein
MAEPARTPFLKLRAIAKGRPTPLGLSIPSVTRFDYTASCIHEENPLTAQNTNRHRVFGALDDEGRSNDDKAAGTFLKQHMPRYFRVIKMGQDIPEQAALRQEASGSFTEAADADLQDALESAHSQLFVFFPARAHTPELFYGDEKVRRAQQLMLGKPVASCC